MKIGELAGLHFASGGESIWLWSCDVASGTTCTCESSWSRGRGRNVSGGGYRRRWPHRQADLGTATQVPRKVAVLLSRSHSNFTRYLGGCSEVPRKVAVLLSRSH